jgi:hypothetical protein
MAFVWVMAFIGAFATGMSIVSASSWVYTLIKDVDKACDSILEETPRVT